MSEPFSKTFRARWGDMDFNSHMRNTAFLDTSADVRLLFFEANGFPATEFRRLRVGPVILKDELEYYRELELMAEYSVTLSAAALSEDAARWRLRNEFFTAEGKLAARVTSSGGWLDLDARRLVTPPRALADAVLGMHRIEGFETIAPRS